MAHPGELVYRIGRDPRFGGYAMAWVYRTETKWGMASAEKVSPTFEAYTVSRPSYYTTQAAAERAARAELERIGRAS